MSELISYCRVCGEYGHKAHCGLEYLDAKADNDVWRTECNILKQTIKNLETGHQKELALARARIEKWKPVLQTLSSKPRFVHHDMIKQMAFEILKACEEKEPTT